MRLHVIDLFQRFIGVKYLLIIFSCAALFLSCERTEDHTLATINGNNITLDSYLPRYRSFLSKTHQKDNLSNRHSFLNSLIDEKLILDYGNNSGLANDPGILFKKNQMYHQLLLNRYHDLKIKEQIEVSDPELRRLFTYSKTSLHVRHLFASNLEKIKLIENQLRLGAAWEDLAEKHLQDPVLKKNGGDIGWYKMGELDPAFEIVAFSLNDGKISAPVKTRKGFSIIQVLEKEKDIFLTERDFQNEKAWLTHMAIEYKRLPALRNFTDNLAQDLALQFNTAGLEELITLVQGNPEQGFSRSLTPVVHYKNEKTFTVQESLSKLSQLSNRQYKRIQSIESLKNILSGLIVRYEMIRDAENLGLHESDIFKQNFDQEFTSLMLNNYMDTIQDGSDPINRQDAYFKFRDNLAVSSQIIVDSSNVKSFPMVLGASL